MSSERDEIVKKLIANARSPVVEGENLGQAARRLFEQKEQRDHPYAGSNPDYVQHKLMYAGEFQEGFSAGANWFCWKAFGKCLLEVMENPK